jgi:DNA-binding Lrp family transcriptional regulator
MFDALDRRILQSLQLDGRIPFSRIAEVLGVSDQTIARRVARLRTEGKMRVLASFDPSVLGYVLWLVRVQCRPDGAEKLGQAIALRDDTSWVSMTSGGTEISCSTWAPAGHVHEPSLLLVRLPRTPGVVSMSAHCVMRRYFGGSLGLTLKSGALTPEEVSALLPEPVHNAETGERKTVTLEDGDRRMLAVLGRDGRADLAELAAATGWSQSAVRRRLAFLRASGAVFLDVEYDYQQIYGLAARVMLWASVPPAELESAGLALAEHPEVAYACATTGATNLHAVLLCKDLHSLYDYLTTRVANLGVRHVEISPIVRALKGPATVRAAR